MRLTHSLAALILSCPLACALADTPALPPAAPAPVPATEMPDRPAPRPVPPPFQNILKNSGMEEGKEDVPGVWTHGAPVLGVEYLWDRAAASAGKASLSLRVAEPPPGRMPPAQWVQVVDRVGGEPLVDVRAAMKTSQVRLAAVQVSFLNAYNEVLRTETVAAVTGLAGAPADQEWKTFSQRFDVPPRTARLAIALQLRGPGQVWFDDIEASWTHDVPPETPVLKPLEP